MFSKLQVQISLAKVKNIILEPEKKIHKFTKKLLSLR